MLRPPDLQLVLSYIPLVGSCPTVVVVVVVDDDGANQPSRRPSIDNTLDLPDCACPRVMSISSSPAASVMVPSSTSTLTWRMVVCGCGCRPSDGAPAVARDWSHMVVDVLLVESFEDSHEANLVLPRDRFSLPDSLSRDLLPEPVACFLASLRSRSMFKDGRQAQTIPMLSSPVLHVDIPLSAQPLTFSFFPTL